MPFADASASPHEEFAAAVERMAARALTVLGTAGGAVDGPAADSATALVTSRADLAAARILGADLFAPYLLAQVPLESGHEEVRAMAEAFRVFPPEALRTATAGGTIAWRDWAAAELLRRSGESTRAAAAPPPGGAPAADPGRWSEWSQRMAQLSPLALPGLDSRVHESARRGGVSLGRGVVRAMLRRDYRTAARIARWLALGQASGVDSPVDLGPVLRHIRLFGGPDARTALDLRVAELLAGAVGR
jgi:hypothetical protein